MGSLAVWSSGLGLCEKAVNMPSWVVTLVQLLRHISRVSLCSVAEVVIDLPQIPGSRTLLGWVLRTYLSSAAAVFCPMGVSNCAGFLARECSASLEGKVQLLQDRQFPAIGK